MCTINLSSSSSLLEYSIFIFFKPFCTTLGENNPSVLPCCCFLWCMCVYVLLCNHLIHYAINTAKGHVGPTVFKYCAQATHNSLCVACIWICVEVTAWTNSLFFIVNLQFVIEDISSRAVCEMYDRRSLTSLIRCKCKFMNKFETFSLDITEKGHCTLVCNDCTVLNCC